MTSPRPAHFGIRLIFSITLFSLQNDASTEPLDDMERATLQLKWLHQFQFAGYYAAKEKGFDKKG